MLHGPARVSVHGHRFVVCCCTRFTHTLLRSPPIARTAPPLETSRLRPRLLPLLAEAVHSISFNFARLLIWLHRQVIYGIPSVYGGHQCQENIYFKEKGRLLECVAGAKVVFFIFYFCCAVVVAIGRCRNILISVHHYYHHHHHRDRLLPRYFHGPDRSGSTQLVVHPGRPLLFLVGYSGELHFREVPYRSCWCVRACLIR